jgi:uncharacterized protein
MKEAKAAAHTVRIGVIADTHGYLDPAVTDVFRGVDMIFHAGDIGGPDIIATLEEVAPVVAVCGNLDDSDAVKGLQPEASGTIGDIHYVVGHKRKKLMKRFSAGKLNHGHNSKTPDLVIFGHEHQPGVAWVEQTLFLNPGSAASPYEEDETPTVAIVESTEPGLSVTFVPLPRRATTSA